jgi:glycosyltransferase involved in cell wall biosynthesis
VWSRDYWGEYLGTLGVVGWTVQKLCARVRQRAFAFSRLHAGRLRDIGLRGEVTVLRGEYDGDVRPGDADPDAPADCVVVFAGRHIPEKRAPAVVPAVAVARERVPALRGEVLGDGPERGEVLRRIAELGLRDVVSAPGFVSAERVDEALRHAACLVLPSVREGYGLVVVEAAARATPSVVVEHPDNAATELVEDGVNGVVAPSDAPADLADAIVRIVEAGADMRRTTASWFAERYDELSLRRSLDAVAASYSP